MIKKETELKNKVSAKGTLVGIDDQGLGIEDTKSGSVDILSYDILKQFIGKEIAFSIAESTKNEEPIFGDDAVEAVESEE